MLNFFMEMIRHELFPQDVVFSQHVTYPKTKSSISYANVLLSAIRDPCMYDL